ncbi:hypothetical protein M430DRAFT_35833 [Amorphotheca resinae ATCC 22711]|uniref:Uncharacterized protein n=1 Tax=Amorphotheca resinae ATCC 22711 TaxID=857342 RepID=A0A2T3AYC0_AMORE|nr:hypothetical protein M430DRAFT_35833 [Amorphotheca resinae ATCC 22711]PSS15040.1 hypothetical protein M430DRAFT_35833 [Amorphotheca resinae ATCC 22711]
MWISPSSRGVELAPGLLREREKWKGEEGDEGMNGMEWNGSLWIDGWMDRWIDRWMDRWMDG